LWENDSWILRQDNAPAHDAFNLSSSFWPKIKRPVAPCDFWLFPKWKNALKGTRSESVEAVKTIPTGVLKALQEKGFQHCFDQWAIRMERHIKREGGVYRRRKIVNEKFVE